MQHLFAAAALVLGVYAVQFLLGGAKIFLLVPAFRVYRGWDPVSAIPVEFQYDLESILPNLVGALVLGNPLDEPDAIMLRYQAVAVVFVLAVGLLGVWRRSFTPFGLMLLFGIGQIAKVNLAWIGKPDMFLLGFLLLAACFAGRPITALFGFLAALCHPVIGVLGCCVLVAAMFAFSPVRLRRSWSDWFAYLWAPAGAGLGYLVGAAFLKSHFPTMAGRSTWAGQAGADLYLNVVPNLFAFAVVSLLPLLPFYLLARKHVGRLPRSGSVVRGAVILVTAAGCFVASAFLALDHSRVLALLAFPLVTMFVIRYGSALQQAFRRQPVLVGYLVLVCMAMPALVMDGWLGFTHKDLEEWLGTLGRRAHG